MSDPHIFDNFGQLEWYLSKLDNREAERKFKEEYPIMIEEDFAAKDAEWKPNYYSICLYCSQRGAHSPWCPVRALLANRQSKP